MSELSGKQAEKFGKKMLRNEDKIKKHTAVSMKAYDKGFEKGKLEQKKEDLKVVEKSKVMWINYVDITESPFKKKWKVIFNDLHKQLSKEIGGMK